MRPGCGWGMRPHLVADLWLASVSTDHLLVFCRCKLLNTLHKQGLKCGWSRKAHGIEKHSALAEFQPFLWLAKVLHPTFYFSWPRFPTFYKTIFRSLFPETHGSSLEGKPSRGSCQDPRAPRPPGSRDIP